jgi:hypothetical protein
VRHGKQEEGQKNQKAWQDNRPLSDKTEISDLSCDHIQSPLKCQ